MSADSKELSTVLIENLYCLAEELLGDDVSTWLEAGTFYGLANSTIYQAKRGEGGQDTYLQIIFGHLKLKPKDVKGKFGTLRKVLAKTSDAKEIETLIDQTWHQYGTQEFAARLRILLANYQLEIDYGLRKKRGRPKKS